MEAELSTQDVQVIDKSTYIAYMQYGVAIPS